MSVTCVHKIYLRNVGDLFATPAHYIDYLANARLCDLESPGLDQQVKNQVVILGGGGLLSNPMWKSEMSMLRDRCRGRLVGWGLGHNTHKEFDPSNSTTLKISDFSLVGIRDWGEDFPKEKWVPCVSCLHPFFENIPAPTREIVVFEHHEFRIEHPYLQSLPRLGNDEINIKKILHFIASGESVVTNSYHGAYWATLMGRKVVVLNPFSTKFRHFKHPPSLVDDGSLPQNLSKAGRHTDALGEARAANLAFASQVRDFIDDFKKTRPSCAVTSKTPATRPSVPLRVMIGAARRAIAARKIQDDGGHPLALLWIAASDNSGTGGSGRTLVSTAHSELYRHGGVDCIKPVHQRWLRILGFLGKDVTTAGEILRSGWSTASTDSCVAYVKELHAKSSLFGTLGADPILLFSSEENSPDRVDEMERKMSEIRAGYLSIQVGRFDSPKLVSDMDLRGRLGIRELLILVSISSRVFGGETICKLATMLGIEQEESSSRSHSAS